MWIESAEAFRQSSVSGSLRKGKKKPLCFRVSLMSLWYVIWEPVQSDPESNISKYDGGSVEVHDTAPSTESIQWQIKQERDFPLLVSLLKVAAQMLYAMISGLEIIKEQILIAPTEHTAVLPHTHSTSNVSAVVSLTSFVEETAKKKGRVEKNNAMFQLCHTDHANALLHAWLHTCVHSTHCLFPLPSRPKQGRGEGATRCYTQHDPIHLPNAMLIHTHTYIRTRVYFSMFPRIEEWKKKESRERETKPAPSSVLHSYSQ